MNPRVIIKNLMLIDNLLEISAKAEFKSPNSYKPRAEIIFSNGSEDIRLPFVISSFNKDDVSDVVTVSLNWDYQIGDVFWNKDNINDIAIDFSLLYGNEFIEDFDVVAENGFFNQHSYYIPKLLDNKLVLKSKKNKLKKFNKDTKKYSFLFTLNSFLLLAIAILGFPFFLIDGFLASKGLAIKSPDYFRGNSTLKSILFHVNWRTYELSGHMYSKRLFKIWLMKCFYLIAKHRKTKENRILFLSERRNDLTGNFEFIYNILNKSKEKRIKEKVNKEKLNKEKLKKNKTNKDKIKRDKTNKDLEIIQFMKNKNIKSMSFNEMINYSNLIATSKIILLDDFYPNIHNFKLKKSNKLIQLWHAVGAFKTFGFSRLGKPGGTDQKSPNHRNYDYAIVSSDEIRRFYAEGFGISDEKVIATGIPRTDIFFDEEYGSKVSKEVYSQYPSLKDKKVILFAPTFRGMGKEDAFYPMDKFNIEELFDSLDNKEDYILIIKHHPFITKKTKIPDKYKNNVIDLSAKSEINDLLFVTNLLITDYSSVIFEASLLDIPMLFYGYDLDEYIRDRDFYYDYRAFVPGKIVKNFESLSESINSNDFDSYKVNEFKHRFFDDLDGRSSERVVSLINSLISQEDS